MGKCHVVQKATGKIIDSDMFHGQGYTIKRDENESWSQNVEVHEL